MLAPLQKEVLLKTVTCHGRAFVRWLDCMMKMISDEQKERLLSWRGEFMFLITDKLNSYPISDELAELFAAKLPGEISGQMMVTNIKVLEIFFAEMCNAFFTDQVFSVQTKGMLKEILLEDGYCLAVLQSNLPLALDWDEVISSFLVYLVDNLPDGNSQQQTQAPSHVAGI